MISYLSSKGFAPRLIELFQFIFEIVHELFSFYKHRKVSYLVVIRQVFFTGFQALWIVALVAFVIGGTILLQGNSIISTFSQSKLFYIILVSIVIKELGVLLTAFIVVARSGTAISTELGNMVVNKEVDALLSFGIPPISYLVIPRVLGMIISVCFLTVYFISAALFGVWIISFFFTPINLIVFLQNVALEIDFLDISLVLFKTVIFGLIISVISCFQGLSVAVATTEVPQRTIRTVVSSLSWIIILNILITILFYFIFE